jgi:hypothetical protein
MIPRLRLRERGKVCGHGPLGDPTGRLRSVGREHIPSSAHSRVSSRTQKLRGAATPLRHTSRSTFQLLQRLGLNGSLKLYETLVIGVQTFEIWIIERP